MGAHAITAHKSAGAQDCSYLCNLCDAVGEIGYRRAVKCNCVLNRYTAIAHERPSTNPVRAASWSPHGPGAPRAWTDPIRTAVEIGYGALIRCAAASSASLGFCRPCEILPNDDSIADQNLPICGKLGINTPFLMFCMVAVISGSDARVL